MAIPISDFEQYIDPTILDRGQAYFNAGHVNGMEELHPGVFEATVLGSRPYTVHITLKEKEVTRCSCTCPYDYGPVCKHMVCLMYYLRQKVEDRGSNESQKPTKRKTVADKIDELLVKIPPEDLTDFSRDLAIKDKQYRNKLMTAFVHLNQNQSKAFYASQVRGIVNAASDRHGNIGWQKTNTVAQQVHELLTTAEKQAGDKHYKSVLYICFAVMEEMFGTLGYVDDSNGDISGCVHGAFEIMHEVASKSLPEPDRKEFYGAYISAFKEDTFSGWGCWIFWLCSIHQRTKGNIL